MQCISKMKVFEMLQQGNYCVLKGYRWNLLIPETQ
jgi:hypothetical protein